MDELTLFTLYDGVEPKEGKYKNRKTKAEFPFIKKADMENAFPAGGYTVVGQIGKGEEQIGTLSVGGCEEPVYKTVKKGMTKIVGFVQVGSNEFLAVVKSTWLLLLLILLLIALLCGLTGFLLHKFLPDKPDEQPTLPPIIIDAGAEEGEGKLDIPDKIETKGKKITINSVPEIRLKANQLEQNFPFANPKSNPCFFVIDVMLADTNEVIYTSDMIPPGYAVSSFKLKKPLSPGTYNVKIRYNTYSFDKERTPLNNMVVKAVVVAK